MTPTEQNTFDTKLDEILNWFGNESYYEQWYKEQKALQVEAKQALTSLIKELVAEAKPEIPVATSWQQGIEKKAFEDAIRVYEYKLLKALEVVKDE